MQAMDGPGTARAADACLSALDQKTSGGGTADANVAEGGGADGRGSKGSSKRVVPVIAMPLISKSGEGWVGGRDGLLSAEMNRGLLQTKAERPMSWSSVRDEESSSPASVTFSPCLILPYMYLTMSHIKAGRI